MASRLTWGLALCAKDALEGMDVQMRLGQQALELTAPQFELAPPKSVGENVLRMLVCLLIWRNFSFSPP